MLRFLKIWIFIFIPVLVNAQDTIIQFSTDTGKGKTTITFDTIIKYDTAYYNVMLLEAAADSNVENILQALSKGADVNTKTLEGVTPLMFASQNGFLDIVKILVYNRANVNAKPDDGATALIAATRFNHYEIMDYLIQSGADINAKDRDSVSALVYAAAYGYYIPTDLLIFYGADINSCTEDSTNALFMAAFNNNYDVAELLLNKGANINSTDKMKWTPLMAAVYNGNIKVTELLLKKGATLNMTNSEGYTALAIATERKFPEISALLLTNGADPNISVNKVSLKKLALYSDSYEVYNQLKKSNAKIEILPYFNNIQFTASELILNGKDFMWGTKLGINDNHYHTTFSLGIDTRFWTNRVLVDYGNNVFYQFRERRSLFYLGIEKAFPFYQLNDVERSLFIDLREAYTYGKYRASTTKPDDKLIFFPSVGYSASNSIVGFKIAVGYYKTGVIDEIALHITSSVFFKIPLHYYPSLQKRIKWL